MSRRVRATEADVPNSPFLLTALLLSSSPIPPTLLLSECQFNSVQDVSHLFFLSTPLHYRLLSKITLDPLPSGSLHSHFLSDGQAVLCVFKCDIKAEKHHVLVFHLTIVTVARGRPDKAVSV